MADDTAAWQTVAYEGFEIHVSPVPTSPPDPAHAQDARESRYTYLGYVCHPGADPHIPGHSVPFHADGEESFASQDEALYEAVHVGRSIVDGTHPDLTVLPLVTGGV
ncbi:hypothetical protein GXB81_11595 [Paraburkholderia sp. Ac-20336]|uniref:hypothetical protein n=1 Tax=Burkholderiaceae TaxID=119060 RepID=UPI0014204EDE|nr:MULTISPECIES: hypothetical protein [Burkholderiaceae]MBN3803690.1 hypothetical protein [Paraburkholderia sp. Ac-20336]MBN3846175.1 hypothetical protein [Paraburkholderia sp. Ac-20342]NIF55417.1 hypothetical protein [Burkholderia sp. Ax-1724]NIF77820.1 hypothetical protein [Paraburkholderia sp. Cy-641]